MSTDDAGRLHPMVTTSHDGAELGAMEQAALVLRSALYHELEASGHAVETDRVIVDGEAFLIVIAEPDGQVWVRSDMDPHARPKSPPPPGRLLLLVTHLDSQRPRGRWTYRPGRLLSPQVKTIIKRLETAARDVARIKAWERADKRRMRRMAARYRWDLEASERPGRLRTMTDDWHEARRVRAFLEAFEVSVREHPCEALDKWLVWARQHADRVDPFSNANIEELVRHAAVLARPKRGKMEPDEKEMRDLGILDDYL